MSDDKLTRKQAADYIGVSAGTLAVWACNGRHNLTYYKHAGTRKVYYLRKDLDEFMKRNIKCCGTHEKNV